MSMFPNAEECIELLRESGCSDEVIEHCIAVRDLAVQIAKKAHADVELVEVAALLHDIGRSKTHGILHGIEGARIAKKLDLPGSIVRIIERHLGAGIPRDEAMQLGLPMGEYVPRTLEEKIVAHADNLIDGGKKLTIERQIEKELNKGHRHVAKRLLKLHEELSDICGINLNDI